LGDAGEAAYEAVKASRHSYQEAALTLVETESVISRLSETRGIKNKTALLSAILRQATQLEAKYPIKLMLATPAADLADIARTMPNEFFVEDKFDGIRAQAHTRDGRVAIYSRTMDEITHRFPELEAPLREV